VLIGTAVALLVLVGVVVWRLNRDVSVYLASRATPPLRLFSAPLALRTGVNVEGVRLVPRLRRLGYRVAEETPEPGTYRRAETHLDVGLRGFTDAEGTHPAVAVRLELAGDAIVGLVRLADGEFPRVLEDESADELAGELEDEFAAELAVELAAEAEDEPAAEGAEPPEPLAGAPLDEVLLEPEVLAMYGAAGSGVRRPVGVGDLPPHIVAAFLAAEDVRFTVHPGIDPVGIARAALVNLTEGAIEQGGSTITQQLAKNVFLSSERRWSRKAAEAVLALILELRLSKTDILETYMNTVYYGRIGSIGLYGLRQASRVFFGQEPNELSVGAAATIAGVLRGPNLYSPLRHPERARARRDRVLATMASEGWIDDEALADARAEPIVGLDAGTLGGAYFVDEVLRRLATYGYSGAGARGLSVFTTLDVEMQRQADRALGHGLEALVERRPALEDHDGPVQGAVVVLDAATGSVRAMTGGRDFTRSQFNRATRARRQPGSAFKPFVYLAALTDAERPLTAASPLSDTPHRQTVGNDLWTPANYDGRFVGALTMRRALAESRNVPAVRVAQHVGLDRVVALAEDAGLGTLRPVPAMALGTEELSLLRLVGGYTVFPNLGEVAEPILIRGVTEADGSVLFRGEAVRRRITAAPATYVASRLLEAVVDEGTGRGVRRLGMTRPLAGKTGTSNDERDAWFVGYTPDLVAGAWVGFDDGAPLGLTGGAAALPIWVGVMQPASAAFEPRSFRVPPGVVFRTVDRDGRTGRGPCRTPVREAFAAGTEPPADCDSVQYVRRDPPPPPTGGQAEAPPSAMRKVGRFFRRLFGGGD